MPAFSTDIDIDLGPPGALREPVREAFKLRGVPVSAWLIKNLRSGGTTPTRTAYRLACTDHLRTNDGSLKTECCLRVVTVGIELRRRNPHPPRVYACRGLAPSLETALGWTHQELSQVVRVMRADLALWGTHMRDNALVEQFRAAAMLFLRTHHHFDLLHFHHGPRGWKLYDNVDLVNVAWDQQTIHGFYFALYQVGRSRMRAPWFPYELDLFRAFYEQLRDLGNPLTPLDRKAQGDAVNPHRPARNLAYAVRTSLGIEFDRDCVTRHRHLLITGSPRPLRDALRDPDQPHAARRQPTSDPPPAIPGPF